MGGDRGEGKEGASIEIWVSVIGDKHVRWEELGTVVMGERKCTLRWVGDRTK